GQLLDVLAVRRRLAGYTLNLQPTRAIRDQYWDTPPGNLSRCQLSLRLRVQDGAPKFTLKRAAVVEDGLFQRPETELPATPANWAQIRDQLSAAGARLPEAAAVGPEASDWLRAAGLEMTQDRCTERRVLIADSGGRSVAEIALDTTTYRVDIYDIVFR